MTRKEKINYLQSLIDGKLTFDKDIAFTVYMSFDDGKTYLENRTGKLLTKDQLPHGNYTLTLDLSK